MQPAISDIPETDAGAEALIRAETVRITRLAPSELEAEIATLAADMFAGGYRMLLLIAEYEERGEWAKFGFASCAAWLAWRCSMTARTAREQVRVARALKTMPLIADAFSKGQLSYSKVRALTRIESIKPGRERELLKLARHATGSQLERMVRAYAHVGTKRYLEPARTSRFDRYRHDDGTMTIQARLPAEMGEIIMKALEKAADELWLGEVEARRQGGSAEPPDNEPPPRPANTDCLVELAASYLEGGRKRVNPSDRYQVVIDTDPNSTRDGSPLSDKGFERISCDSTVINAGRKSRRVPTAMKRILEARDHTCRYPGCRNRLHLDAHHIKHWSAGGETATNNLIRLCRRHHRLVHEGDWGVRGDPDSPEGVTFIHPARVDLEQSPRLVDKPSDIYALERRNRGLRIRPGPETSRDLSRGERMSLSDAVFALVEFCG